jgi:hypothetical protein
MGGKAIIINCFGEGEEPGSGGKLDAFTNFVRYALQRTGAAETISVEVVVASQLNPWLLCSKPEVKEPPSKLPPMFASTATSTRPRLNQQLHDFNPKQATPQIRSLTGTPNSRMGGTAGNYKELPVDAEKRAVMHGLTMVFVCGSGAVEPWSSTYSNVAGFLRQCMCLGVPCLGDVFGFHILWMLLQTFGRQVSVVDYIDADGRPSSSHGSKPTAISGQSYFLRRESGDILEHRPSGTLCRAGNVGLRYKCADDPPTMSKTGKPGPSTLEANWWVDPSGLMQDRDALWATRGLSISEKMCVEKRRAGEWIANKLQPPLWPLFDKLLNPLITSRDGIEVVAAENNMYFNFHLNQNVAWARFFVHQFVSNAVLVRAEGGDADNKRLNSRWQLHRYSMQSWIVPGGARTPAQPLEKSVSFFEQSPRRSFGGEVLNVDCGRKHEASAVRFAVASPRRTILTESKHIADRSPSPPPVLLYPKEQVQTSGVRYIRQTRPACFFNKHAAIAQQMLSSEGARDPYLTPEQIRAILNPQERKPLLGGQFVVVPCNANPPTKYIKNYVVVSGPYDPPCMFKKKLRPTDKNGFLDKYRRGFVFNFKGVDPGAAAKDDGLDSQQDAVPSDLFPDER